MCSTAPTTDMHDSATTVEPAGSLEPFELKASVWELVVSKCPQNEAEEIKAVLGESLVEQTCDLREEALALLEIWRQFREETDQVIRGGHHAQSSKPPSLPEPPAVRQRLIQEIQYFVEYLSDRSKVNGGERQSKVLQEEEETEGRGILDYVMQDRYCRENCGSRVTKAKAKANRPVSAVSSRDGRDTPLRYTPSSEEGSSSSLVSERVQVVGRSVNLMSIHSVVGHLRDSMEEECATRRWEIEFLQECIEDENAFRHGSVAEVAIPPPPSLQELRKFGTQLEKEILEGKRNPAALPHPPSLPPIHPSPPPGSPIDTSVTSARLRSVKQTPRGRKAVSLPVKRPELKMTSHSQPHPPH